MSTEPYHGFPPHQSHSSTSFDAAALIADQALTLRDKVFKFLQVIGGATDEEMQIALRMSANTQRPRRCELEQQGRVIDSGQRRKTRARRDAVVWIVTPGQQLLL